MGAVPSRAAAATRPSVRPRVTVILLILGALLALGVWWRFFHIARPEMPPLQLTPDDPLILEATSRATQSLDRFRELLRGAHKGAMAKVRFVSNSNETEFL